MDQDYYGDAMQQSRPDERDEFYRLVASILITAIDDACDQKPKGKRERHWRDDAERIEQIVEGLCRLGGDPKSGPMSINYKAIEAVDWLFANDCHPLSARGICDAMGVDIQQIRHGIKHRPAELWRIFKYERKGLKKMTKRREPMEEAA